MTFTEDFINGLSVEPEDIIKKISTDLNINDFKVRNTVKLLKEDNSIPFISRYRKEMTGYLDEMQVRDISHQLVLLENLDNRKIEIIKTIFNRGLLTEDLYINIMKSSNMVELEDIYAPFKQKKKTRAMIAVEKGLDPLAELMITLNNMEIEAEAVKFIDVEKGVNTVEEALQGAMDILAEKLAHSIDERNRVKDFLNLTADVIVEGLKNKEESVYQMYYEYKEPLKEIKPHRILAINRGEKEGELKVEIDFDLEKCIDLTISYNKTANNYHKMAIEDGLKRLLLPSIMREIRGNIFDNADEHGIGVFVKNLNSLLMQPPIKKNRVIGIDPGIRTGTKGAALDETGKYLGHFLIYQHNKEEAKKIIAAAVKEYKADIIAIGNGTGSYEVQQVISEAIKDYKLTAQYTVVSEDGASVYSASDIAREEFPDLDLTIRGAISIGRRLQDPLAELVKIDPKSIGVGLYQHDVNQVKLSEALDEVVESVVNQVGVNLNTASYSLLRYVSGLTSTIAKNIVHYRNTNGSIKKRNDLKNVKGVGEKTFEQAAGFLKIPDGENPLDNTWVHPENYEVAQEILKLLKVNQKVSSKDRQFLINKYNATDSLINEIIEELKKPNLDPRADYPQPIMQKDILSFEDLKVGVKVVGKIKNVVDFGAFVDIGLKETALLHISQISNTYIKNPHTVLKVGDVKNFTIIDVDTVRKRISLSMKGIN